MKAEERDKLFNEGCDARLAGASLDSCPYQFAEEMIYWRAGWNDLDRNWGADAKWPHLVLVEV